MQGFHHFIPTESKIRYINQLLKAGFDSIDFGSFVSPKAIPQMRDTAEVLAGLNLEAGRSRLLAIIANTRGAETAVSYPEIQYLGFPFSISETFQRRNTNSGIAESLHTVADIQELCLKSGKELVIYISMGFGNPYGDVWNVEIVEQWTEKMAQMGVGIISLSDTIGIADAGSIEYLFSKLIPAFPAVEFGAHLHTTPDTWHEKVHAAYTHGCRRFDGAIKGFGGCPMAADELTGNMPTENLLLYMQNAGEAHGIDQEAFAASMLMASEVFV